MSEEHLIYLPCGEKIKISDDEKGRCYEFSDGTKWRPNDLHRVALMTAILHHDKSKYHAKNHGERFEY